MGGGATAVISFPTRCRYLGGHRTLGRRGRHLWIRDGRIGHGFFRLTHSIPLTEVTSVEVSERQIAGSARRMVYAAGVGARAGGSYRRRPVQITDCIVRTTDAQEAAWEVSRRSEAWVRDKLRVALLESGVPFFDELTPGRGTGRSGGG
jgi:hypothetical protein